MFTAMLEQTMTVRRLGAGAGIKRVYTELGPYPCLLQPLSAEKSALLNLALGSAYKLYTDIDADVQASDEVIVNGVSYKVNGTKDYNFGTQQHKELIVTNEAS